MHVLKNYRVIIWLFFVVVSILLISPNTNPRGYRIIESGSGLSEGEIIYKINGVDVNELSLHEEYFGTIKVETNKGHKFITANGTLQLETEKIGVTNLKFGLDIKGGVHAVVEPNATDNGTLEQIISTLQTRINVYGLREASFRPVYHEGRGFVDISIAGGSGEELRQLIERQGKFEAKIPVEISVFNGTKIKLDRDYSILLEDDKLVVDNKKITVGEELELSGIKFIFENIEDNRINLTSYVFTGKDIVTVYFDPQRSGIQYTGSDYRWYFSIQLSGDGAQRFALVTQNLAVTGGYLESPINMYLDDNLIDSLLISSTLRGRAEPEISISGGAATFDDAESEKLRLQSILRSGALPTSISIVQLDTISPTLGSGFLQGAMLAGVAAIAGVSLVVLLRYRKLKIVIPLIVFSLSEVIIIFGIAVLIGWTIDIAAIAGIIAVVGTGVDSQIIIVDQAMRGEKVLSLSERMKRAFFIIFGAAGTVIAAMLPLMVLGFGLLRGFAITTIIGVLAAVLITRPAFGVVIQRLVKD